MSESSSLKTFVYLAFSIDSQQQEARIKFASLQDISMSGGGMNCDKS